MPKQLPLANVRVANFGWVWAGPVVGQTLGFMGAEVYKIESRARIDLTRTLPPFAGGVRDPDRSLSNHACWGGNGSVTLNLKKPEALALARELIAKCDVVIENFGPGFMTKAGLGYDDLRKIKPDIILFSMPAAGLYGPLKRTRICRTWYDVYDITTESGSYSDDRLDVAPTNPLRSGERVSPTRW